MLSICVRQQLQWRCSKCACRVRCRLAIQFIMLEKSVCVGCGFRSGWVSLLGLCHLCKAADQMTAESFLPLSSPEGGAEETFAPGGL